MNRADASWSGLYQGTFDDVIRRSGADDIAQLESGLGIQQLEVIGRPLFPLGYDEHVQVRELRRVGIIPRPHDPLDHEELLTALHCSVNIPTLASARRSR
jgi:hypothetical protein